MLTPVTCGVGWGRVLYLFHIPAKHVPSNGTVVKIFTHKENDLDDEFYVHEELYVESEYSEIVQNLLISTMTLS
jgi:hypothetical protein